jgi:hypothetical protein
MRRINGVYDSVFNGCSKLMVILTSFKLKPNTIRQILLSHAERLKFYFGCFSVMLLLGGLDVHAQKKESAVMNYLNRFKDKETFLESKTGTSDVEILLLGTFHFRNNKLKVPTVEQQVIDFNPQSIFVEEVPPEFKEVYYNMLYTSPRRGSKFYSRMIDSLSLLTGIKREEAEEIARMNTRLLEKDSQNIHFRIELINALYVSMDEPNGHLQLRYLKNMVGDSFDTLNSKIPSIGLKYRFSSGETKYLSVPIATRLNLDSIESMDYQEERKKNDSLLSIANKKMIPGLMLKLWKLPYLIKMMNLSRNIPENTKEAIKQFDILNRWKTIKNMAKVHEIYLNKPRVEASQIWLKAYRKRNREMVKMIVQTLKQKGDKRAVVIVGASHVPYFLYEFDQQYPKAQIRFLDNAALY